MVLLSTVVMRWWSLNCIGDLFDVRGQRVRTFGSHGDRPEQMIRPAGIAVDDVDNIYVSSCHKLQKFTSKVYHLLCQWVYTCV